MSRRTEILRAVEEAKDLVEEFPVEPRTSFDLIAVLDELDIPVLFRPLDSLWGATVSIGDLTGILVNDKLPRQVQRFTLGHELGHLVLGHENQFDEGLNISRRTGEHSTNSIEERAAQTFASWLLAPRKLIKRNAAFHGWDSDDLRRPPLIYQLSLRLGLSFSATCWSLVEHNVLPWERANELDNSREFPKILKDSLVPDSIPRDSRSDVWTLTEGDAGCHLEASRDDVFMVKLDEQSSAGYIWEFGESDSDIEILHDEAKPGDKYGSPSSRTVYFRLQSPGEHTLSLEHKRPWNSDLTGQIEMSIDNWGKEGSGFPRRVRQSSLAEAAA